MTGLDPYTLRTVADELSADAEKIVRACAHHRPGGCPEHRLAADVVVDIATDLRNRALLIDMDRGSVNTT